MRVGSVMQQKTIFTINELVLEELSIFMYKQNNAKNSAVFDDVFDALSSNYYTRDSNSLLDFVTQL